MKIVFHHLRVAKSCCGLLLLLLLLFVGCREPEAVPTRIVEVTHTATPISPTATPTATASATLENTPIPPTITPSPTMPPTASPTVAPTVPALDPTEAALLIPLTPQSSAERYHLAEWTEDDASRVRMQLEAYVERGYHLFPSIPEESSVFSRYRPLGLFFQEMALRHPEDADTLNLAAALNLAVVRENESAEQISAQIVEMLNDGRMTPDEVAFQTWFMSYPSNFELEFMRISADSFLITIKSVYFVGNMTTLIVQEATGYVAYQLYENFADYNAADYQTRLFDLTGDGAAELIIDVGLHNGSMIGHRVVIFDLSQTPPLQLEFEPIDTHALSWSRGTTDGTNGQLIVGSFSLANCPASSRSAFVWNGQWFVQQTFEIRDEQVLLRDCLGALHWTDNPLELASLLSHLDATEMAETGDDRDTRTDEPLTMDSVHEFELEKAIAHAVLSQSTERIATLLEDEAFATSQWAEVAEQFMVVDDLYQPCLIAVELCSTTLALTQVVDDLLPTSTDVVSQLIKSGVNVTHSGLFDFEHDDVPEHWIVVEQPVYPQRMFWILAQNDGRLKAIPVRVVREEFVEPSHSSDQTSEENAHFMVERSSYHFVRSIHTGEPYVRYIRWQGDIESSYQYRLELNATISALLDGQEPQAILPQLQALLEHPAHHSSAQFSYYTGLAHEWNGDEANAILSYWDAWQQCCLIWQPNELRARHNIDPYAIMARSRLTEK